MMFEHGAFPSFEEMHPPGANQAWHPAMAENRVRYSVGGSPKVRDAPGKRRSFDRLASRRSRQGSYVHQVTESPEWFVGPRMCGNQECVLGIVGRKDALDAEPRRAGGADDRGSRWWF